MEHLGSFGEPNEDGRRTGLWRDPDALPDEQYVLIAADGSMIRTSYEGLQHLADKARAHFEQEEL